jgi:PAS domain S-box-containing protein
MAFKILLLEDSDDDAILIERFLNRDLEGCSIVRVETLTDFMAQMGRSSFDVVVSDFMLGGFTGMDAVKHLNSIGSEIPFILISGTVGEDIAVDALKAGVSDYVMKNNLTRLPGAIRREVMASQIRRQKKSAEKILQTNRANLIALIENTSDSIWSINRNLQITILNQASRDLFTMVYSIEVNPGAYFPDVLPASVHKEWDVFIKTAFLGTKSQHEIEFVLSDGNQMVMEVSVNPIFDEERTVSGVSFFAKDITEQKRVNDRLTASLNEKEILLAEVHHRVKNNLAIISGILMLQLEKIDEPNLKLVFTESISKIKSIALIHEKLYQNDSLAEIEFGGYIRSLGEYIASTMSTDKKIDLTVDVDEGILNILVAIPCGLILSELITNSYKHAFTDRESGHIHVRFSPRDTGFILSIQDDGNGTLAQQNMKDTHSIGMTIVEGLASQIGATLTFDFSSGTLVTVEVS